MNQQSKKSSHKGGKVIMAGETGTGRLELVTESEGNENE